MATISYHTNVLDCYLQKIYNNNLTIQTQKLGSSTEQFDKNTPGMFETLSVDVTSITGIDVPVLVSSGNVSNQKVVAIVAQDPRRDANDKMLEGLPFNQPIIGTPFAIHYKQSVYPQTEVYRQIINGLLNKRYNVYITDAHKIYSKGQKKGRNTQLEIKTLENELKGIKPDYVITFGTTAKNYIEKTSYIKDIKETYSLLHPSQTNWDHWKQWIFEQAFWGKDTYNVNWTNYAKKIGSRENMFGSHSNNPNMHKIIAEIVMDIIP